MGLTKSLLFISSAVAASPTAFHKVLLPSAKFPDAKCIDGSQAGYYFRLGSSQENVSETWVVYLEGGGWCYDEASCESRCGTPSSPKTNNSLCSSERWPETLELDGIMTPPKFLPALAGATQIFVRYCSSDAHMGNASPSHSTFGWNFRGAVIVESVIRDLTSRGLGSLPNTTLIFGGGSAGGRGAMVNLDYVETWVNNNVSVLGFLDSNYWIDEPAMAQSGFVGFSTTTQGVFSIAAPPHLGKACEEAFVAEKWKCLFGQYRMPFISTPYIMVASQADSFQLSLNVGHLPKTSDELMYAKRFAEATANGMESLASTCPRGKTCGMFSWNCYSHSTSLTNEGFDGATAAGETMAQALAQVMGTEPPTTSPPYVFIDTCKDFACGPGCKPSFE